VQLNGIVCGRTNLVYLHAIFQMMRLSMISCPLDQVSGTPVPTSMIRHTITYHCLNAIVITVRSLSHQYFLHFLLTQSEARGHSQACPCMKVPSCCAAVTDLSPNRSSPRCSHAYKMRYVHCCLARQSIPHISVFKQSTCPPQRPLSSPPSGLVT